MLRRVRNQVHEWMFEWGTTPRQYSPNHTTLGLPTRCWCGWHWSGYYTPRSMEECNRHTRRHLGVVREVNNGIPQLV